MFCALPRMFRICSSVCLFHGRACLYSVGFVSMRVHLASDIYMVCKQYDTVLFQMNTVSAYRTARQESIIHHQTSLLSANFFGLYLLGDDPHATADIAPDRARVHLLIKYPAAAVEQARCQELLRKCCQISICSFR